MKRIWIIMSIILILTVGISIGIITSNNKNKSQGITEKEVEEISEMVNDECIDEWETIQEDVEANSDEEKISPNCKLTLKRYYTECKHMINEYLDIPSDLINKTQEDLEIEYENWEVQKYSSSDIVLYREFDSDCGQHFVLRNVEGKVMVYLINENNEEELFEETDISVEYLTETDKIEIENGIEVYGQENLNQLLEDFE